jgi:DNA-binding winged helix-turn-helix (wHTH) protein/tetratricopeptide (TPR) repeat protein
MRAFMSLETNNFYDFGRFRLDLTEKVLLRDGEYVPITPKVFETLQIFVENAGRLIEKDELMQKLWQDRFVEESNLTFNVKMLRKALGDSASKPVFIETVPKRGYRFIAEVRRVETKDEELEIKDETAAPQLNHSYDSPAKFPHPVNRSETKISGAVVALADSRREAVENEPEESAPEIAPEKSNGKIAKLELVPINPVIESKPKYHVFALIALLVGAIGLGYYFFSAGKTALGTDGKKSIAVLPLKPINTANRDELYEIGIADSLILKLSSMNGFIVRPLSATRKYADIEQDSLAAGREQQVDYVLASNYQLAGGKIKVTAQLFNVGSGQIEETYKSEKDAANLFAMQDAIASEVGNNLLARFAVTSNSLTAKRGTTNEEAYRLYLQGTYLYHKRTPADARKAIEALDQAVSLDPNYALAWAGKAHAHRYAGNLRRDTNTHEEYKKSIEAINKALALDENLSEAHSALCENKYFYEYDFDGAERECKRAIELDPNSSMAHEIYSRYLNSRGRFDEAIAESKTAIDLEPTLFFNQRNYGLALYFARRYEEAVAQFKRVITTDKNPDSTFNWLISALALQGNHAEAFEWFMKSRISPKGNEETLQVFKTAYQTSGWQGVLREQIKGFDESNQSYYFGAGLNAQVGNKDKAFEYLEKSYQRREWGLATLQVEPRLDSLRDDPRFDELVRRVGFK